MLVFLTGECLAVGILHFTHLNKKEDLNDFVRREIMSFKLKANQPSSLIVKEVDIRRATGEVIGLVCNYLGIDIHETSLRSISSYLGVDEAARRLEGQNNIKNSTGHEFVSFYHLGHVSEVPSREFARKK